MTHVWHLIVCAVLFDVLTVLFCTVRRRSPEQTDVTFWNDEMNAHMETQR